MKLRERRIKRKYAEGRNVGSKKDREKKTDQGNIYTAIFFFYIEHIFIIKWLLLLILFLHLFFIIFYLIKLLFYLS